MTATFDNEHWIYWVGPLLGALIAWCFYRFIKTLEYEVRRTANVASFQLQQCMVLTAGDDRWSIPAQTGTH